MSSQNSKILSENLNDSISLINSSEVQLNELEFIVQKNLSSDDVNSKSWSLSFEEKPNHLKKTEFKMGQASIDKQSQNSKIEHSSQSIINLADKQEDEASKTKSEAEPQKNSIFQLHQQSTILSDISSFSDFIQVLNQHDLQTISVLSNIYLNFKLPKRFSLFSHQRALLLFQDRPQQLQFLQEVFDHDYYKIDKCLKNPYKEYAFAKPAKKKYIEKKYELRLGFKIFDMDHFLKCRWDDLQIIDMKGCQIDDKKWQKLITNIETFKFLEQLNLNFNQITTVQNNHLQRLKNLPYFNHLILLNNPLSAQVNKTLTKFRLSLHQEPDSKLILEFNVFDLKLPICKFSTLTKKRRQLLSQIPSISFTGKDLDQSEWDLFPGWVKQFKSLTEIDFSDNLIGEIKLKQLERLNQEIQKREKIDNQQLSINLIDNPLSKPSYKTINDFQSLYPYSSLIIHTSKTPIFCHNQRVRLQPIKHFCSLLLHICIRNCKRENILEKPAILSLFQVISESFQDQLNNGRNFQEVKEEYMAVWKYAELQCSKTDDKQAYAQYLPILAQLLQKLQTILNQCYSESISLQILNQLKSQLIESNEAITQ